MKKTAGSTAPKWRQGHLLPPPNLLIWLWGHTPCGCDGRSTFGVSHCWQKTETYPGEEIILPRLVIQDVSLPIFYCKDDDQAQQRTCLNSWPTAKHLVQPWLVHVNNVVLLSCILTGWPLKLLFQRQQRHPYGSYFHQIGILSVPKEHPEQPCSKRFW